MRFDPKLEIELLLIRCGVRFQREFRFHPTRKWRFDWAVPYMNFAIEYEGATWAGGRHVRGAGYSGDCEKYSEAAILGWRIIRLAADMFKNGKAQKLIKKAFGGEE